MDFLSHALWAYAITRVARLREWKQFVIFSVLPDVVFGVPVLAVGLFWALSDVQVPWEQGLLAANSWWINLLYHSSHSLLVLAAFALVVRFAIGLVPWAAMGGWFLHVALDVFVHKGSLTPAMPFYPLGPVVEGVIHWHEPWFLALDWALLVIVYTLLLHSRRLPA